MIPGALLSCVTSWFLDHRRHLVLNLSQVQQVPCFLGHHNKLKFLRSSGLGGVRVSTSSASRTLMLLQKTLQRRGTLRKAVSKYRDLGLNAII
eukprot:5165697-Amphidinium_carterae.1